MQRPWSQERSGAMSEPLENRVSLRGGDRGSSSASPTSRFGQKRMPAHGRSQYHDVTRHDPFQCEFRWQPLSSKRMGSYRPLTSQYEILRKLWNYFRLRRRSRETLAVDAFQPQVEFIVLATAIPDLPLTCTKRLRGHMGHLRFQLNHRTHFVNQRICFTRETVKL